MTTPKNTTTKTKTLTNKLENSFKERSLRHLMRVMRKHDPTNKKTTRKTKKIAMTNTSGNFFKIIFFVLYFFVLGILMFKNELCCYELIRASNSASSISDEIFHVASSVISGLF